MHPLIPTSPSSGQTPLPPADATAPQSTDPGSLARVSKIAFSAVFEQSQKTSDFPEQLPLVEGDAPARNPSDEADTADTSGKRHGDTALSDTEGEDSRAQKTEFEGDAPIIVRPDAHSALPEKATDLNLVAGTPLTDTPAALNPQSRTSDAPAPVTADTDTPVISKGIATSSPMEVIQSSAMARSGVKSAIRVPSTAADTQLTTEGSRKASLPPAGAENAPRTARTKTVVPQIVAEAKVSHPLGLTVGAQSHQKQGEPPAAYSRADSRSAAPEVLTQLATSLTQPVRPQAPATAATAIPTPHPTPKATPEATQTSSTVDDMPFSDRSEFRAQKPQHSAANGLLTVELRKASAPPLKASDTQLTASTPNDKATQLQNKPVPPVQQTPQSQTPNLPQASAALLTPPATQTPRAERMARTEGDALTVTRKNTPPTKGQQTPAVVWTVPQNAAAAAPERADILIPELGMTRAHAEGAQPTALQHTAAARTDLPPQLMRQLAEVIPQASNRPVEITLSPEELGRVRLSLSLSEASVTVNLLAERPETLDLLRRHIDLLGAEFRALGFENIAFAFGGESDGDATQDDTQPDNTGSVQTRTDPDTDTPVIKLRSGALSGLDLRL